MELTRWFDLPYEEITPLLRRQMIHGSGFTLARLLMKEGAVVPRHHHFHEQVTTVQTGRLLFVFDEEEVTVVQGESLAIEPDRPHRVVALEDSEALDLFVPVREDWIRGDDAYLRSVSE